MSEVRPGAAKRMLQEGLLRKHLDSGNLTLAAFAKMDCLEAFAARALIGITGPAIAWLRERSDPEARFYLGCAYWIDGDEDAAIRTLELVDTPAARKLLALI